MIIDIFAAACISSDIIPDGDIVHIFFETDICAVILLEKHVVAWRT